jgi:uncharacterized spore protein YtfJ
MGHDGPEHGKEMVMSTQTTKQADLANELLERIGQTVGKRAQASAVFGDPVQREGLTVIPVARSRFGFGGGGGSGPEENQGSGTGGGGGASVSPVGYIEVRDDGARFKRILTPMDVLPLVAAAAIAALTLRRLLG